MTLRQINQFATGDARLLDRQLSELEDNCDNELHRIDAIKPDVYAKVTVRTDKSLAGVGDMVLADTAAASMTLLLRQPQPANVGRSLFVAKAVAVNTLTLQAPPDVLINGSLTPLALTARAGTFILCDGSGYWTVQGP